MKTARTVLWLAGALISAMLPFGISSASAQTPPAAQASPGTEDDAAFQHFLSGLTPARKAILIELGNSLSADVSRPFDLALLRFTPSQQEWTFQVLEGLGESGRKKFAGILAGKASGDPDPETQMILAGGMVDGVAVPPANIIALLDAPGAPPIGDIPACLATGNTGAGAAPADDSGLAPLRQEIERENELREKELMAGLAPSARGALLQVMMALCPVQQHKLYRVLFSLPPSKQQELLGEIGKLSADDQWELGYKLEIQPNEDIWDALRLYLEDAPATEVIDIVLERNDWRAAVDYAWGNEEKRQNIRQNGPALNYEAASALLLVWWYGQPAVTNGRNVLPGDAPWQVELADYGPVPQTVIASASKAYGREVQSWEINHICGGVRIQPQWILTAAHCILNKDNIDKANPFDLGSRRIRTDTNDLKSGILWRIDAAVVHQGYDPDTHANDIALMRIAPDAGTKAAKSAAGDSIRLPARNAQALIQGIPLWLTGWGFTGETLNSRNALDRYNASQAVPRFLKIGEVQFIDRATCQGNPKMFKKGERLYPGQMCAGSAKRIDACAGDSGGPLFWRGSGNTAILVGLVSYGKGCGVQGMPGVYTDVRYYLDWIESARKQAVSGKVVKWRKP